MQNPRYIMSATPEEATSFPHFFDSNQESVMHILEHPGSFRYAGWDLQTSSGSKIVEGECIEASNGNRKVLQLFEDGTFLAKVSADGSFLGWGRKDFRLQPRLNPLAVIEVTTSFVHLYRRLSERLSPTPKHIRFRIELQDTMIDNRRLYMNAYGVDTYAQMLDDERYEAGSDSLGKDISVEMETLQSDKDHVAYKLVERFYLFFGIPSDKIPYVSKTSPRRIDTSNFTKIK